MSDSALSFLWGELVKLAGVLWRNLPDTAVVCELELREVSTLRLTPAIACFCEMLVEEAEKMMFEMVKMRRMVYDPS